MPEISRFYGIIIRQFRNDHPPTHFHAVYGEHAAQVTIETLEVEHGWLPTPQPQLRMVQAWAAIHQEELRENWRRLQTRAEVLRIEPLR